MEEKFLLAQEKVKKYGQEQLLSCYEKLEKEVQEKLLDDIIDTDFDQIKNLYLNMNNYKNDTNAKIEAIPFIDKEKLSIDEIEKYSKIGQEVIKNGEYAVITMAGGQGTRLGHTGPIGTYILGEPVNKSIF